jgi:hypothetical protein
MFNSKKVPSIKAIRRTNRKLQALIKKEAIISDCLRISEGLKFELETCKQNNMLLLLGAL